NPRLMPAQVRDILQRTATPLPPYYLHEVGAGMLNAQAAVLESAFSQRRFGQWRGVAFQNQVQFISSGPQTFTGTVAPGSTNNSPLNIPSDSLLASVQMAWGDVLNPNNLSLTLLDAQGVNQAAANAVNSPGLTGRRQRALIKSPNGGAWTAQVGNGPSSIG